MSQLRQLSLSVDEPIPGAYRWTVLEFVQAAPSQKVGECAGFSEWLDAWNAGSDALLALVKDGRLGPRADLEPSARLK